MSSATSECANRNDLADQAAAQPHLQDLAPPPMMQHERRLNTRKPLDQLAYLSLPPNNGGIVLDVSEGGLGFHAIAPVDASGPIEFIFEIDSDRKITAVGELAWKDSTGKSGGLRFTELADETRLQIRQWADEAALKQAAQAAARAIAKAISAAIEVSESVSPNEAQAEPNGNAEPAHSAQPSTAEASASIAIAGAANGHAEMSGGRKVSAAVTAAANPSLSGKPEVARVVTAPVIAGPLATASLRGDNGTAETLHEAPDAVASNGTINAEQNLIPTGSESENGAHREAAAAVGLDAPVDLGVEWVREANVLISARAAGVDDPVAFTPPPEPVFTIAAPELVDRADVPPSVNADVPLAPAAKTQLLYNRKPPIYSSPAYEFSMFTPEAGPEAPVPIPTMLGALQSAISKHPVAAVGLTAALAFLVSIGIFSYLCAGPAGDALANTGEKIWSGMYSHPMPAETAPPASPTAPARTLQQ